MGEFLRGTWRADADFPHDKTGHFVRPDAQFRNWVTADGSPGPTGAGGFKAEPGRYHLIVSLACPWAHRTLIFRKLKRLEGMISLSVVHWLLRERGWAFDEGPGVIPDPIFGAERLSEFYVKARPDYSGRLSVPVLWDKQANTIVNNESSEIIRMFNGAFDGVGAAEGDFYPVELRDEIDALNARIYATVNNGVYRAGFATTQEAYEEAFRALFETLDWTRGAARPPAIPVRQTADRGGLAALHHACPLRPGLFRPLQVQPAPDQGLSCAAALSPRALSLAGSRRDGRLLPHQASLLREPSQDQSDRHRAARAGDGFVGSATGNGATPPPPPCCAWSPSPASQGRMAAAALFLPHESEAEWGRGTARRAVEGADAAQPILPGPLCRGNRTR